MQLNLPEVEEDTTEDIASVTDLPVLQPEGTDESDTGIPAVETDSLAMRELDELVVNEWPDPTGADDTVADDEDQDATASSG